MLFTTVCQIASQRGTIGAADLQMNSGLSFQGRAAFSSRAN